MRRPLSVPLTGIGLTAGSNVTLSIDKVPFGTELVGTTNPALSVLLSNYGTDAVSVTSITTTANFAASNDCVPSVASGATCTIGVTFTPSASGDTNGTLSIADDSAGNPHSVQLTGTGSTATPVLTGACVEACEIRVPSPSCHAGDSAHSPGGVFLCGSPTNSPTYVPIDRGHACFTGGSTRAGNGYCGTQ